MSLNPEVTVKGVVKDAGPASPNGARCPETDPAQVGPAHHLMRLARRSGESGASARLAGDELAAERFYQEAVSLGLQAIRVDEDLLSDLPLMTARWALDGGDARTARHLLQKRNEQAGAAEDEGWAQIADVDAWGDAWLIATVRRSPPDEAALDALVQRYWKPLLGRCQMLTLKRETAADLAQDTWCRVLRGHTHLKSGGNFKAYLLTIATNLWRDSQRAALRAGALAQARLTSLDGEYVSVEGTTVTLGEILPDLSQLEGQERDQLKLELDHALGCLDVFLRDVLVARFLDGESCADIGRRFGRTEQTVSAWVRRAISELKHTLEDSRRKAC